jgi:hypothetical protein
LSADQQQDNTHPAVEKLNQLREECYQKERDYLTQNARVAEVNHTIQNIQDLHDKFLLHMLNELPANDRRDVCQNYLALLCQQPDDENNTKKKLQICAIQHYALSEAWQTTTLEQKLSSLDEFAIENTACNDVVKACHASYLEQEQHIEKEVATLKENISYAQGAYDAAKAEGDTAKADMALEALQTAEQALADKSIEQREIERKITATQQQIDAAQYLTLKIKVSHYDAIVTKMRKSYTFGTKDETARAMAEIATQHIAEFNRTQDLRQAQEIASLIEVIFQEFNCPNGVLFGRLAKDACGLLAEIAVIVLAFNSIYAAGVAAVRLPGTIEKSFSFAAKLSMMKEGLKMMNSYELNQNLIKPSLHVIIHGTRVINTTRQFFQSQEQWKQTQAVLMQDLDNASLVLQQAMSHYSQQTIDKINESTGILKKEFLDQKAILKEIIYIINTSTSNITGKIDKGFQDLNDALDRMRVHDLRKTIKETIRLFRNHTSVEDAAIWAKGNRQNSPQEWFERYLRRVQTTLQDARTPQLNGGDLTFDPSSLSGRYVIAAFPRTFIAQLAEYPTLIHADDVNKDMAKLPSLPIFIYVVESFLSIAKHLQREQHASYRQQAKELLIDMLNTSILLNNTISEATQEAACIKLQTCLTQLIDFAKRCLKKGTQACTDSTNRLTHLRLSQKALQDTLEALDKEDHPSQRRFAVSLLFQAKLPELKTLTMVRASARATWNEPTISNAARPISCLLTAFTADTTQTKEAENYNKHLRSIFEYFNKSKNEKTDTPWHRIATVQYNPDVLLSAIFNEYIIPYPEAKISNPFRDFDIRGFDVEMKNNGTALEFGKYTVFQSPFDYFKPTIETQTIVPIQRSIPTNYPDADVLNTETADATKSNSPSSNQAAAADSTLQNIKKIIDAKLLCLVEPLATHASPRWTFAFTKQSLIQSKDLKTLQNHLQPKMTSITASSAPIQAISPTMQIVSDKLKSTVNQITAAADAASKDGRVAQATAIAKTIVSMPINAIPGMWAYQPLQNQQNITELAKAEIKQAAQCKAPASTDVSTKNNTTTSTSVEQTTTDVQKANMAGFLPPENFDASVRKLYMDYKEILQRLHIQAPLTSENTFQDLLQRGQAIPAYNAELLPLIFPHALIAYLYEQLGIDSYLFQVDDKATFTLYYEFTEATPTKMETSFQGSKTVSLVVYLRKDNNETKYAYLPLFTMDALTLAALNGFTEDSAKKINSALQDSRNLIYAMYCGYTKKETDNNSKKEANAENSNGKEEANAEKNAGETTKEVKQSDEDNVLTMPGKGTFCIANNKLTVPKGHPFQGFYTLLENKPKAYVHFSASTYDIEAQEKFIKSTSSTQIILTDAGVKLSKTHQQAIQVQNLKDASAVNNFLESYTKQYYHTITLSHIRLKWDSSHLDSSIHEKLTKDKNAKKTASIDMLIKQFERAGILPPSEIFTTDLHTLNPNVSSLLTWMKDEKILHLANITTSKTVRRLEHATLALQELAQAWGI